MSGFLQTDHNFKVTWLGHVPADGGSIRAGSLPRLDLGFAGDIGARHEGENRESCVRVVDLYAKGTLIRNVRQLTLLSAEEMQTIASEIDLDNLDPQLLGASMVVQGIPDFTHVPPSSRLQFTSGLTLTVDMENRPCLYPAKEIETESPGHGKGFKTAATGRRGVTAWVERPGTVAVGDSGRLFVPAQRAWAP